MYSPLYNNLMFIYFLKQIVREIFLYIGNPLNIFDFSPQHLKLIESGPFDSVLHIGADIGQELALYKFIGVRRVIWIEPNKKSMLKLKIRSLFYPSINHIFINRLISDKDDEEVTFYEFNRNGASSRFLPTTEFLKSDRRRYITKKVVYNSCTIQKALEIHGIYFENSNNLLVIDAQCSEYNILNGFNSDLISKFDVLMCEISVDQYEINFSPQDLINLINKLGYKEILKPIRKSDDAVYLKVSKIL